MNIVIKDLANKWKEYTLENDYGMMVSLLNYGGIITRIITPDKAGNYENVVLGYENVQDYATDEHYLGALMGRVAGRIENARFKIGDELYELEQNEGSHHLHGGSNGFHQILWEVNSFRTDEEVGVKLSYTDTERNCYPGELDVVITYTLNNRNQLMIKYVASTNKTTPITLTNHSYFNLTGNLKDTIHNHLVTINSHRYLELDNELIPTGKIVDVADKQFDFQQGRKLNEGIVSESIQNAIAGNGYDHYFLFNEEENGIVTVEEPLSGRKLTIESDQPGMVMYTSTNMVEGLRLRGSLSKKSLGVCFETQASPASLNHNHIPSTLLNAGEVYEKQTTFTFSVVKG